MTELVVLGAGGMLGRALVKHLAQHAPLATTRADADVTNADALHRSIPEGSTVINASAYTDVDGAESDEGAAFAINADAVRLIAETVKAKDGRLIHISTDYVFDGTASKPYDEGAIRSPMSAYGRSKLVGEQAVEDILPDSGIIVRTGWLYGYPGKSFPATILTASRDREFLDVVTDQVGQPTWTGDVAAMVESLVVNDVRQGIFHATNSGQTSWNGFARAVFRQAGLDEERIRPVTSETFPRPAPRPSYSVLGHSAWELHGLQEPRPWEDALAEAWARELHQVLEDVAR
jgi:dTDP-4-dehydrorhamnose reductase